MNLALYFPTTITLTSFTPPHPTRAMWIPLTERHAEYLPLPCSQLE